MAKSGEQPQRWFERMAKDAASGNSRAAWQLGSCFECGWGTPKDLVKAIKFYRLAASLGDSGGLYSLARCYREGIGVRKNGERARNYLMQAADLGDPTALYVLGNSYRWGTDGVRKDVGIGFQCLLTAAKLGHLEAQVSVGYSYSSGEGTGRNPRMAAYWYKKAADAGDELGAFNYGFCLDAGYGVKPDPKRAAVYYRRAARHGNSLAMFNLALLHESGNGVSKSTRSAQRLFQKCAETGNPDAMFCLAMNILGKRRVPSKNVEAATYWLSEAASKGHKEAKEQLDSLRVSGRVAIAGARKMAGRSGLAKSDQGSLESG